MASFKLNLPRFAYAAPIALGALLACSAAGHSQSSESENSSNTRNGLKAGPHKMPPSPPKNKSPNNKSAPAGANLTYRNGPIIPSVKVYAIYWGNSVNLDQNQIAQYFTEVAASDYVTWLGAAYPATNGPIAAGSFAGVVIDSTAPQAASIDDTQIQAEIGNLVQAGKVPPPDENNLYFFYFPPNMAITAQGDSSCVTFCGYHNSATVNGTSAYYAVIPDLSTGGCDNGCGSNATVFENVTEVSSHELIESITDPEVGFNNLAWYDDQYGEIGDICVGEAGNVGNWTVQLEYSDADHDCVLTGSANNGSTSAASTGSGFGGGFGGGLGSSTGSGWGGGWGGSSGSGNGGWCDHDSCTMGDPLDPSCNPAADDVCQYDDYCCNVAWDDICVWEGWSDLGDCF